MNKPQKVIVGFLVAGILLIALLYGILLYKQSLNFSNTLYFSYTCPHCKIVEDFIAKNNITGKIIFENKEVSQNQQNAKELIALGTKCRLASQNIGAVPLLYFDGVCYLGDIDIIAKLNQTLNNLSIK